MVVIDPEVVVGVSARRGEAVMYCCVVAAGGRWVALRSSACNPVMIELGPASPSALPLARTSLGGWVWGLGGPSSLSSGAKPQGSGAFCGPLPLLVQ